jgi:RsiW-degrading membrane proteinase PrsW (M82 family)
MDIIITPQIVVSGILGGFLPSFLWLWFWLYQDRKHPEPKGLLAITFILGMITVFIAMVAERAIINSGLGDTLTIIINSVIEEVLKLGIPAIFIFNAKSIDEPIDYAVYLITAALGFAALENFAFVLSVSSTGMIGTIVSTSNLRFVGATVLHAVTATSMGLAIGWNFYKSRLKKWEAALLGLFTASALHMGFNLIIMKGSIAHIAIIHAVLWSLVVIAVILIHRMVERNERFFNHNH